MGFADRPYYGQPPQTRHPMFSRLDGMAVVKWLLIINIVVHVLNMVLIGSRRGEFLAPVVWGHFNIEQAIYGWQVWRFFTYQFLHSDFLHLLFNMIMLFFFGPLLERWWGSKRFLAFYLLCGMSGAVIYSLLVLLVPGLLGATLSSGMVGASGSLYGILIGCAVLWPNQQVMLLIPPIPMKLRTMAFVIMGLVFLSLIAGSSNAGGEAAHLGGALLGFVLIRRPRWLDWADRFSLTQIRQRLDDRSQKRMREKDRRLDYEIDRILAKISTQGMGSLTEREKDILRDDTERKKKE